MKKALVAVVLLGVAFSSLALEKAELDRRAEKLLSKFEALQQKPDKRVPAETLRKAQGIILLDRTKAGFVFAYQGGGGLAMAKDKKGNWSPVAFMSANEGSLGFQIGGQQSFFVILLMTPEAAQTLVADGAFEFGGEARGTAGDSTAGAEGTVASLERSVIVYSERQGLFGGAAVKGGAISPDHEANRVYYGGDFTMKEILFDKKLKPTAPATDLARKIALYSKSK